MQAFTGFLALEAPKNPHEILGVRASASEEEIDAAYRRKAMMAHPDKGGSGGANGGIERSTQEAKRAGRMIRSAKRFVFPLTARAVYQRMGPSSRG
jgi:curved DNA-binding protein CbpA